MGQSARSEVTRILSALGEDDPEAATKLLPLVYEELRSVAHDRMRNEPSGLTLQPTALVHEAYLRLVEQDRMDWKSRRHFFAAAAEAMRRILIERARKYRRAKHGGGRHRLALDEVVIATPEEAGDDILALDKVLRRLEEQDSIRGRVVKLRYFAGLTIDQTAEILGLSPATVKRHWTYARAWLFHEMTQDVDTEEADS
jgi:RNA polymerase sigma factor (TIGR02999 family)